MPTLHFVKEGRGPLVVLGHALGCDLTMWDGVAAQLAPSFTVLRYDQRGHGQSPMVPGPFSIEDMADDAAALIAAQADGPVHFVGLSMGGMVAQALAARHPQRVASIVVANSSSLYDDAARAMWQARIDTVKASGMTAISDGAMQRWFTPEFRQDRDGAVRVAALRAVLEASDAGAYADACDAVSRIDFTASNARIACPVLVIGGTRDEATPMAMSEAIRGAIAGAELAAIHAAHLSAVEKPAEFARLVAEFIRRH
ncbi:alpha/beta fold hydrolase [Caenimonas aquaedulcis]|uniref:Alpha/beta fold hydrolase n=1 Tax=Caenimonas aquaedulcis TaxID=2793270 RepID=A0A931MFG2_9BURK|nr:alpha/beta fold hydrolase [Caenimonas aquaedulcis]MBG9386465.1 alpha/beta fold hydrolase [Caenimonas aquaedulcis]